MYNFINKIKLIIKTIYHCLLILPKTRYKYEIQYERQINEKFSYSENRNEKINTRKE